jgi:hypothetical protein
MAVTGYQAGWWPDEAALPSAQRRLGIAGTDTPLNPSLSSLATMNALLKSMSPSAQRRPSPRSRYWTRS